MIRSFFSIISILTIQMIYAAAPTPVEGMWLPNLLESINYPEMREMGLELSPEDIYSVNSSSLKDAIVSFGGFCTGSMISEEGLLLTNHHCGNGQIQYHSSLENDYLKEGFWAMSKEEELMNPGLFVTFIRRIDDVTMKVLNGVSSDMSYSERSEIINANIKEIEEAFDTQNGMGIQIKSFYNGNSFYQFTTQTYNDVRLVGAPPTAMGAFGGDTDNWMWPRHTADFSLFRVYADENNNPADPSEDNVPYIPAKSLDINIAGVEEGDFTMVFGFPGRTQEYLTSFAVEQIMEVVDPTRIELRTLRLDVIDKEMKNSDQTRIQYAAKQARIANGWKKWQGEIKGLERLGAIEVKETQEEEFRKWAILNERSEYSGLLSNYSDVYSEYTDLDLARTVMLETVFSDEILRFAFNFYRLKDASEEERIASKDRLIASTESFYKNFSAQIEKKLLPILLEEYLALSPEDYLSEEFYGMDQRDAEKLSEKILEKSIFMNMEDVLEAINDEDFDDLFEDIATETIGEVYTNYVSVITPEISVLDSELDSLHQLYMKGLIEFSTNKVLFPDANSTLRVGYGKVQGYEPADGIIYKPYTTLDGLIEKVNAGAPDYILKEKLQLLQAERDYGDYATNDSLRVNFIASNHTTGGNSGSPVLNARGELVGLNFDRSWESTMSDIMYDPERCRNICVDSRYLLFVIDKFADASYLLDELQIITERPTGVASETNKEITEE